jgi:hypothetical protein
MGYRDSSAAVRGSRLLGKASGLLLLSECLDCSTDRLFGRRKLAGIGRQSHFSAETIADFCFAGERTGSALTGSSRICLSHLAGVYSADLPNYTRECADVTKMSWIIPRNVHRGHVSIFNISAGEYTDIRLSIFSTIQVRASNRETNVEY